MVELGDSVRLLQAKLAESEAARAGLVTARAGLQQDARLKEIALGIDRGRCMGARGGFPANLQCGAAGRCKHRYRLGSSGVKKAPWPWVA